MQMWLTLLPLLPVGQVAESKQSSARTRLVGSLDCCVGWMTMKIHHLCRNVNPSVKETSTEQTCALSVPHSSIAIPAHHISVLRYNPFLIPIAILNAIYCCIPSILQGYFPGMGFLWLFFFFFFPSLFKEGGAISAELCDMLWEALPSPDEYSNSSKQT